jgi:hypothetical protein
MSLIRLKTAAANSGSNPRAVTLSFAQDVGGSPSENPILNTIGFSLAEVVRGHALKQSNVMLRQKKARQSIWGGSLVFMMSVLAKKKVKQPVMRGLKQ